jgi:hypothetical protein
MPYLGLDAQAIRGVMPPASRGTSDDLLVEYLAEWEANLTRRFPEDELPASDLFLKGVLRDLAASSGMRKNATNDEEYRAADALYESAMGRLRSEYDLDAPTGATYRMRPLPWG